MLDFCNTLADTFTATSRPEIPQEDLRGESCRVESTLG